MIKKNGNNKWVLDIGEIIKILLIMATALAVYYSGRGEIKEVLVNHEVRIHQSEKVIDKHDDKIDKLFETKADRD